MLAAYRNMFLINVWITRDEKITFLIALLVSVGVQAQSYVGKGTADSPTYQENINCSAVMKLSGVLKMKAMNEAPSYARDKYKKQVQFFMQGQTNLENQAKRLAGYANQQTYESSVSASTTNIFNNLQGNKTSYEQFLSATGICLKMAGLNMSDFPN